MESMNVAPQQRLCSIKCPSQSQPPLKTFVAGVNWLSSNWTGAALYDILGALFNMNWSFFILSHSLQCERDLSLEEIPFAPATDSTRENQPIRKQRSLTETGAESEV